MELLPVLPLTELFMLLLLGLVKEDSSERFSASGSSQKLLACIFLL